MRRFLSTTVLSLMAIGMAVMGCQQANPPFSPENDASPTAGTLGQAESNTLNIIFVAPPSGEVKTDRENIEAAVAKARPGDIIQFDKGLYLIGSESGGLVVDVPNTVLQGHPEGTILKGGDDIAYWGQYEGLILTGGQQAVRHITFESFSASAINLNWDLFSDKGGYCVEHNKFLNCYSAVTYYGQSEDISLISNNLVDNNSAPFWVLGKTCHIKWNKIISTKPEMAPLSGYPANLGGFLSLNGIVCENNVFAFNIIANIADGMQIGSFVSAGDMSSVARNNSIMNNHYLSQKVYTIWDLGTMAWLFQLGEGGPVYDNHIINNTYEGWGGISVILWTVAKTNITNNSIKNIRVYPNSVFPSGYGIFVDEFSHHNRIINNRFQNNNDYDVALYGNENIVIAQSRNDKILDEGEGNIVRNRGARFVKTSGAQKRDYGAVQQKMEKLRTFLIYHIEKLETTTVVSRDFSEYE